MSNEPMTNGRDHEKISERIRDFILAKMLPGEEASLLTDTTPLVSGGVIDSMNSLKVGLFLEKTFSIRIAPEELANPENLETIPAITRLVASKIAG